MERHTFRADLKRSERKLVGGEWVEVPMMVITPRDVALLLDRPSTISEGRGVTVTSEAVPVEVLREIVELTRGRVELVPQASPIPRSPRRMDD